MANHENWIVEKEGEWERRGKNEGDQNTDKINEKTRFKRISFDVISRKLASTRYLFDRD